MAQDYDEVRPDVAEASARTLKDVQQIDAPTAKTVGSDLEETDLSDGQNLPGAIIMDELVVEVIPQAADEILCVECFTIRYRSQVARRITGIQPAPGGFICRDCADL